ncbi:metal ABC transporter ATP-binding protein [Bacteroidota bacterium]
MEAIKAENIYVNLDGNSVLEDINLTVNDKEFLGIIGPNGGGKTTLLKVLLGMIQPARGKIKVFGKDPDKSRGEIGYVPQYSNFDIDYPISVRDVVMMGRLNRKGVLKRITEKDSAIVDESLGRVNLLEYKNRIVGNLSGGEKQRVLIARALTSQPQILLLDEPTASVDSKTGKSFYDLLKRLNEEITIILVSHDIGAISTYVKKIACLNKKLFYHDSKEISKEMLEEAYHCPVDLIAHGVPHRVLDEHDKGAG